MDEVAHEGRGEAARLHKCYVHAEAAQFNTVVFCHRLKRPFAGVVRPVEGHDDPTQKAGDVEDQPVTTGAHGRGRGTDHALHAEEVDVKEALKIIGVEVFLNAMGADACVVNEHVDLAKRGLRRSNA